VYVPLKKLVNKILPRKKATLLCLIRRYTMGQTIDIEVDINANHWGHFELKICPVDGKHKQPTQAGERTREVPTARKRETVR
jgi:hypothetical protein